MARSTVLLQISGMKEAASVHDSIARMNRRRRSRLAIAFSSWFFRSEMNSFYFSIASAFACFTEKRLIAFRSNLTHAAARAHTQERPAGSLSCWLFHITTYLLSWGKLESNPRPWCGHITKKNLFRSSLTERKAVDSIQYLILFFLCFYYMLIAILCQWWCRLSSTL